MLRQRGIIPGRSMVVACGEGGLAAVAMNQLLLDSLAPTGNIVDCLPRLHRLAERLVEFYGLPADWLPPRMLFREALALSVRRHQVVRQVERQMEPYPQLLGTLDQASAGLAAVADAFLLPDGGEFSPYSRKLARAWGRILLTLHRIFEHEAEFAIGFLFNSDEEAQFEEGQYGKVYFVNPVVVVEQKSSGSRSFRKRFKLTERDRLIAIAAHEFIHGGLRIRYHDEEFASKQTDVFGTVMARRRQFNWCFQ